MVIAKWGLFILCAAGIAACLWVRLAYPGSIPFIADEPLLQMILDDHLKAHTFPLVTMRGSSIPLAYGAGALWIYAAIRSFVSSLEGIAIVNSIAYTSGILSLYLILRKRVERGVLLLVLWLALSSPFLFFFSRFAWDNTFFVPLSAVLLLLLDYLDLKNPSSKMAWAALGFVTALMINIHLMAGPVVLAAGLTALVVLLRSRMEMAEKVKLLAIVLLVFLIMVVPYLVEAVRLFFVEGVSEKTPHREIWGDARNLWWLLQRSMIWLSTWKAHDFYGPPYIDFEAYCGKALATIFKIDILGWIPKILAIGYIFGLMADMRRRRHLDAIRIFLFLSFFSTIGIFNLLNIPTEAHYFHAAWWIAFIALAFSLDQMRPHWRAAMVLLTVCCALINTTFILLSSQFIETNHGMHNHTYGMVVRDIRAAYDELCQRDARKEINVLVEVYTLIHPMHYFNRHLPACAGKELHFVLTRSEADWVLVYKYGLHHPSCEAVWEKRNHGTSL